MKYHYYQHSISTITYICTIFPQVRNCSKNIICLKYWAGHWTCIAVQLITNNIVWCVTFVVHSLPLRNCFI